MEHPDPSDSVELLGRYERGDALAADEIHDRYAQRLLALVRTRLSPRLRSRVDGDDILQSTYRSFFIRAREGEFVTERSGDLWRLLSTLALRKISRAVKHHRAGKRSYEREGPGMEDDLPVSQLAAHEPTPAEAVAAVETFRWLLAQLEPAERPIVEQRMQGYSVAEIAASTGQSERTVRRWLAKALDRLRSHCQEFENSASDAAFPKAGSADELASVPAHLKHSDYRLHALIAAGGTAKVYRATRKSDGQPVAVKILRKELRQQPGIMARFAREADIVSRLRHEKIVPVHGLGKLPDGGYFLVMDFIEGSDLEQLACRGPISASEAARIVACVGTVIQYAHDQGVIHRDLKPGNVLVDRQGAVFVTDFGFAWGPAQAEERDDAVVGTAGFMAPEQVDPKLALLGPQTDVYGLGALLFGLLRGRPPYEGRSVSEILSRVAAREPSPPPLPAQVPVSLRAICAKCLAYEASERYVSASEVVAALATFSDADQKS